MHDQSLLENVGLQTPQNQKIITPVVARSLPRRLAKSHPSRSLNPHHNGTRSTIELKIHLDITVPVPFSSFVVLVTLPLLTTNAFLTTGRSGTWI